MKKAALILCICTLLASLPWMNGKAETNTYTIRVDEFNRLKVNNDINVRYVCNTDSAGLAVFTCEDRFADAFIFSNKNGVLKISINTDYARLWDYLPAVTVYSTFLTSAENQSKLTLDVIGVPHCPELTFKQVGNGTINASDLNATKIKATIATGKGTINIDGEAEYAVLEMIGTGKIDAENLEVKDVSCKVLGTGSITCWPIDKLSVSGLASTTVYYKGEPATIKKSGVAKIEPLK